MRVNDKQLVDHLDRVPGIDAAGRASLVKVLSELLEKLGVKATALFPQGPQAALPSLSGAPSASLSAVPSNQVEGASGKGPESAPEMLHT